MSIDNLQRTINNLDKEIANLEKKKSYIDKERGNLEKKINSINKSITKNTSISMINSKNRQINDLTNKRTKKIEESASIEKKISEREIKKNEVNIKLQKEQKALQKKQDEKYKKMQKTYESYIDELRMQLQNNVSDNLIANNDDVGEKYDVFISHAWEDKVAFVDEFVQELENLDINVWYDKENLTWGDSMRNKIDEGLKKSRFGVAIISPNYIADGKYWTKAEFNAIFQLESVNGKMLLPIWHNISKKEVMQYSPILVDKLALNTTDMTPEEIAKELKKLLEQ